MKRLLAKAKEFFSHPSIVAHRAFLTIFALNAAVYAVTVAYPGAMEALALHVEEWSGTWPTWLGVGQLFTSMFDHANFPHFFYNMLIVAPFAWYLEHKVGSKQFWAYWLISGIGAALVFMNTPRIFPWFSCLGASGACFGIIAAACALVDEHPIFKAVALFVLMALVWPQYCLTVIGLVFPSGIATAAHLGGAATALVLAHVMKKPGA